jgi:hypothetical protein
MKTPIFNKFAIKVAIRKLGYSGFIKAYQELGDVYDKENGSKFATAEDEVNDVLKQIPELNKVKVQLIEITRGMRLKAGLSA